MADISFIRNAIRNLGLGRVLLRARQYFKLGFLGHFYVTKAKRKYLSKILRALPLESKEFALEVHMLLHHARLLEGMWAFYSLARFFPSGCKLVVHDDGSLQSADVAVLKKIFPSCFVIERAEADVFVNEHFKKNGLEKCRKMRDSLVFGLKLFDVALYAKSAQVLLLDSDVLTFKECAEIIKELQMPDTYRRTLYMEDVCNQYCLDPKEICRQLGQEHIIAFNPGIALVQAQRVDFQRLEKHLEQPGFWNADGSANYFAELTLWAMEMSLNNAQPLPKSYAIAPSQPGTKGMTCCHYCGGVNFIYLFYTDGIPQLVEEFTSTGFLQE